MIVQCAWCMLVRDEKGNYTIPALGLYPEASHGVCPPCQDKVLERYLVKKQAVELDDPLGHREDIESQVFTDTQTEIVRATTKHGGYWDHPNRSLERWYAILAEEFGEAGKEVVEICFAGDRGKASQEQYDALYAELTQTAAMALETMMWLRWKGLVIS